MGDTIVEVMIVLAVLGLALSISYATANRSLLAARAAQESAQANVLLKTQIENLRILAAGKDTAPANKNIFTIANAFCVSKEGFVVTTDLPAADPGNAADTNPCVRDPNVQYEVKITRAADNKKFTAVAVWDDVSGDLPRDSATLIYIVP